MKYNLIILFIAFAGVLKAQTWTIEPGTLNCGNVLVSQSSISSFSASFDLLEETNINFELEGGVTNFVIADNADGPFDQSLVLTTNEIGILEVSIFVKFTPMAKGSYGNVTLFVYDDLGYIDLEEKLVTGGGVAPEIEVRGNSLVIADGDNTPSVDRKSVV